LESTYAYYTPTQTFTRKGLQVYDARVRWQPGAVEMPGPFLAGEGAIQRNVYFNMLAYGFYGEVGWRFTDKPWSPTISFRYAQFSGDNLNSATYGRWDPLYSGGTTEQWVQGINDFKIFQDSNLITQLLQVRLRPSAKWEIIPQAWLFEAQSLTNLGGNPALSYLSSTQIGSEFNVSVKYFASRRMLVQGSVADTFAGAAVAQALGSHASSWLSTMLFLRYAF